MLTPESIIGISAGSRRKSPVRQGIRSLQSAPLLMRFLLDDVDLGELIGHLESLVFGRVDHLWPSLQDFLEHWLLLRQALTTS